MNEARHFRIEELVSKRVFTLYGENAWQFFDPRLIETIDFIRDKFGVPIYANDWYRGGDFQYRGLRENLCPMVSEKTLYGITYLSPHVMGRALDFDVKDMTADEVRADLKIIKLPYPIRLENNVNWVHLDMVDMGVPVYTFNV